MTPDPIAFTLGPLTVRWYGLLIAIALLIGVYLGSRDAEKQGIDLDRFFTLLLITLPVAIVGSRLFYVLFRLDAFSSPGEWFMLWKGGLSIHGAVIAGFLTAFFACRRLDLSFWKLADIASPYLILGQAIGRWGNYFNQEAYGYPTDLPWAMYIAGAYRHPTFLYEFIWNLLVFAALLIMRRRLDLRTGDLLLTYIGGYSLGRFFIEALRTDSLMLGPLRVAQVVSVAAIAAVLVYRFWWVPRQEKLAGGNEGG